MLQEAELRLEGTPKEINRAADTIAAIDRELRGVVGQEQQKNRWA